MCDTCVCKPVCSRFKAIGHPVSDCSHYHNQPNSEGTWVFLPRHVWVVVPHGKNTYKVESVVLGKLFDLVQVIRTHHSFYANPESAEIRKKELEAIAQDSRSVLPSWWG